MSREDRWELAELAALLSRETGVATHRVGRMAAELMRLATAHHELQEAACNRELSSAEMADEQNIEGAIKAICDEGGWTPDFQGDPRGATVKLRVPSGRTTDFGQTGVAIPTLRAGR